MGILLLIVRVESKNFCRQYSIIYIYFMQQADDVCPTQPTQQTRKRGRPRKQQKSVQGQGQQPHLPPLKPDGQVINDGAGPSIAAVRMKQHGFFIFIY